MKVKPGDISIVEKPRTFLLWYDTHGFHIDKQESPTETRYSSEASAMRSDQITAQDRRLYENRFRKSRDVGCYAGMQLGRRNSG